MIICRITLNALPGKRRELSLTLLSMMERATGEKGCLAYEVFCDIEGKPVFHLIEDWETREDLERHICSDSFSVLLGAKSLLTEHLAIKIHTVSHSEGVEVVNFLRGKETSKMKERS